MEILDVVDEHGCPTGQTVERSRAHLEGVRHRTAHLWLLRRKDSRVQILLQKRSLTKASFPGCYDISSAGHIPAGCDYAESAVRELREELGLCISPDEMIFCGDRTVVWDACFHGVPFHDRQYSRVFCVWKDVDESDLLLQTEEVESVRWMDLNDCIEAVKENHITHCIYLGELYMVQSVIESSI